VNVVVKKVQPYPIHCELFKAEGQPGIACDIVKLTEIGFLIKIAPQHRFRVFDKLICQFMIPVDSIFMEEKVKVIKTYHGLDTASSPSQPVKGLIAAPNTEKVTTMELHFYELKPFHKETIQNFLTKIGQK